MVSTFLEPIDASPEALELAVEAIAEVGPAGHFFATKHTQDRYTTEFYSPLVSDWRNWETWTDAGQPDAYERAEAIAQEFIAGHVEPDMNPDRRAQLREFVDRRVAEGGVPTDY
ncbi:MAG: trimethylamine--corrinoid protein Co-methyltransferase [Ilumatobacter sp.]|jgi:trimethylamine--corrinoid protein Co-methyltransferase